MLNGAVESFHRVLNAMLAKVRLDHIYSRTFSPDFSTIYPTNSEKYR